MEMMAEPKYLEDEYQNFHLQFISLSKSIHNVNAICIYDHRLRIAE